VKTRQVDTDITMTKSAFIGGSLSFKGDKEKTKKKTKKSKHKADNKLRRDDTDQAQEVGDGDDDDDDDMTEAERKAMKFKMERQRQESEKVANKSHRERVEEFNEKLGSLTEHNDIPRVSAAGNG
jgi:protein FAM32A